MVRILKIFLFLFMLFGVRLAYAQSQNISYAATDTICNCKPSLPIEIAATSIIWGLPTYWIYRSSFDHDSNGYNLTGLYVIPSLFLLMPTLGFTAEWTSGCKASHWHTLWIGLGTGVISALIYGSVYGFSHAEVRNDFHKFNFFDYLALGVVPSVASVFIFNLFLHCPEKDTDQSMYLFPSFGSDNSASLNFMMKF